MLAIVAFALVVGAVALLLVRVSRSPIAVVVAVLVIAGSIALVYDAWTRKNEQGRTETAVNGYCEALSQQLEAEVREYRMMKGEDSRFEPRDLIAVQRAYVRSAVERSQLLRACVKGPTDGCLPLGIEDASLARIEAVAAAVAQRGECPKSAR